MTYGGHFDIDKKLDEIDSLEREMNNPTFWDDRENSDKVINKINELKKMTETISKVRKDVQDTTELLEVLDESMVDDLNRTIEEFDKTLDELEINLLLDGPYDKNNCIVEIHSGAGGTEACDWANMLYRMYQRYCERVGYKIELLNYLAGEETGIKSVSFLVKGLNSYGYLKGESGIHRLVRLSPFDANNRRHTSFASVEVIPEFSKDVEVNIDEKDLKIDVYRSSGAGGQHVNTTDSAVRITHLPTKIVVTCQNGRSQIQNKEEAMRVLKNKLYLLELEKKDKELNNIRGEVKNIDFGSQIRSYVMHPYSMVKDHRNNIETSNVNRVLDGDIDMFIEGYLKMRG